MQRFSGLLSHGYSFEYTKHRKMTVMKILVTGGAGFIGSHIVDRLLERGETVEVMDNLTGGFRHNLPSSIPFHELDIRSEAAAKVVLEGDYNAVVHLAAQMSVAVSTSQPSFDADVNIRGLLNLMEAARLGGTVQKVLFSSTGGAMYDDNVPWPTPEEEIARPVSPYGIAKLASELYLRYYSLSYGIRYTALRLGNVYGPRQNPHGEAGVIAIFARKMLSDEQVQINGDGGQTRDYVFVQDVVNAFMSALDNDVQESMNVGTSIETSVLTLHSELSALHGSAAEPRFAPARAGEVRRSCLSNKKIIELLDWKPKTSLEQGLSTTFEFFKRQASDPSAR